jgi:hypothetical protein
VIAAIGRLAAVALLTAGAAPPNTLFRFADPRIVEASGIAHGLASPDVFYVENDSGDSNRFFAVDRRTGATAATVTVTGARNVDWEDIAVAPDAAGTPSVWLADIGDNDAVRRSVQVYRVAEPRIDSASRGRSIRVSVAQEWRLQYPGGPSDAEGLAVAPDGTAYIVTKSIGSATVYRLPADPHDGRVQVLRRVGGIGFHPTGTDNPLGVVGQMLATGATISTDGSLFVVRTYADAWVWRLGAAGLASALRGKPAVVALARQRQGEGVAVVGRRIVVDSEGAHTAVSAVPLPRLSTSTGTPTAGTSVDRTTGRTGEPRTGPSGSGGHGTIRLFVLVGLLVAGLGVLGAAVRVRRPR